MDDQPSQLCPECHAGAPAGARFCDQCGAALTPDDPVDDAQYIDQRQATVLMIDLVGSTALSETLDPEELREVLHRFHDLCGRIIRRYGGHVHQHLGDGLLSLFGYPLASEDDPVNAINAGLAILHALRKQQDEFRTRYGTGLSVRIGAHTGPLITQRPDTGKDAAHNVVFGETLGIASEIERLAPRDQMLISDTCQALAGGFFHYELYQPTQGQTKQSNRGALFRVLSASGVRSRHLARQNAGDIPLLGREDVMAALRERWRKTVAGEAQAGAIEGEPGMGKSRLVEELCQRIESTGNGRYFVLQCQSLYSNTPLHPIIETLEYDAIGFKPEDDIASKQARLEDYLHELGLPLEDYLPLLCALLAVPVPDRFNLPELTGGAMRKRRMQLIAEIVRARGRQWPTLYVLEDAHWADPSTLELLAALFRDTPGMPIMLLVTSREAPPPNIRDLPLFHVHLDALPRMEIESIVRHVGGDQLAPAQRQQIADSSEGVPLFAIELARATLDAAGDSPTRLAIPNSLQASLTARIDRMPEVRELLRIAACMGRDFSLYLLAKITGQSEATLEQHLARLVGAGMLERQSTPLKVRYRFSHMLVQQSAYQGMLRAERRQMHLRIAETVEQGGNINRPEWLARQFAAAEQPAKACKYWLEAGKNAVRQSDLPEALAHLREGLRLVHQLPQGPARDSLELALLATMAPALVASKGFGHEELGQVCSRAGDLGRRLPATPELAGAWWGLAAFYLVRSELDTAVEYGKRLIELGQTLGEDGIEIEGHWTLSTPLLWQGKIAEADREANLAVKNYDPKRHHRNAYLFGQDPGVASLCYRARTRWHLGAIDDALADLQQAEALAKDLGHDFSHTWAIFSNTVIHAWTGDWEKTIDYGDYTVSYCAEKVQPHWLYISMQLSGWARVHLGDVERGLRELDEGMAAYRRTGAIAFQSHLLALHADAARALGRREEGLTTVAQALALVEKHGEALTRPWLFRIKGDLLAETDEAASVYQQAIQEAIAIDAKSRELEARLNYAEWQVARGEVDAAVSLLQPFMATQTQGLDTYWPKQAADRLRQWTDGAT